MTPIQKAVRRAFADGVDFHLWPDGRLSITAAANVIEAWAPLIFEHHGDFFEELFHTENEREPVHTLLTLEGSRVGWRYDDEGPRPILPAHMQGYTIRASHSVDGHAWQVIPPLSIVRPAPPEIHAIAQTFLTVKQVAGLLSISESCALRWASELGLAQKIGGRWRFPSDVVERALALGIKPAQTDDQRVLPNLEPSKIVAKRKG